MAELLELAVHVQSTTKRSLVLVLKYSVGWGKMNSLGTFDKSVVKSHGKGNMHQIDGSVDNLFV